MKAEEKESEFPKLESKGTKNGVGFKVEARYLGHDSPADFGGGVILGKEWKRLNFVKAQVGVPQCNPWHRDLIEHNLLSNASAQALRWWFIANVEASEQSSLCLETRIVTYSVKTEHDVQAISAGEMK